MLCGEHKIFELQKPLHLVVEGRTRVRSRGRQCEQLLPDKDHMGPRAGECEGQSHGPRAGEYEGHMGPGAGEHGGDIGPRAGEYEGHMGPGLVSMRASHMGPRAGGFYRSLGPSALAAALRSWPPPNQPRPSPSQ